MKNLINLSFSNFINNDAQQIMDLIHETEAMARQSIEDLPKEIKLFWWVTSTDPSTDVIRVGLNPIELELTEDFEVQLYCRDLEAGYTIKLNGEVIPHDGYKSRISVAIATILRNATALA